MVINYGKQVSSKYITLSTLVHTLSRPETSDSMFVQSRKLSLTTPLPYISYKFLSCGKKTQKGNTQNSSCNFTFC